MQDMTIGELKTHFSAVLERVRQGKEIVISYGKKKEKVAVIIPYRRHRAGRTLRKLGILEGKAGCRFADDFAMTDEELLSS